MTILEDTPGPDEILDFINGQVQQLRLDGAEAKYIVVGPASYRMLRKAIGARFGRGAGTFETYNYIPIVLDPARDESVCVLPSPEECAKGVRHEQL